MELISVIIPIYNGEKYIARCIKSIINQTINNFEIVVIDDGSTDNTRSIVEKLIRNDSRVKYKFIENSGPGSARNEGIKIANGNLLCFVDADDFITQDMLEVLSNAYMNYKTNVIISKIKISDQNNVIFNKSLNVEKTLTGKEVVKSMLYESSTTGYTFTHGKLYNKKFITDNNIKFENINYSEDMLFNLDVYLNSKEVTLVDNELYCYFINNNSITRKYDSHKEEKLDYIFEKMLYKIERRNLINELDISINSYIFRAFYCFLYDEIYSDCDLKKQLRKVNSSFIADKYRTRILSSKNKDLKSKLVKFSVKCNALSLTLRVYYHISKLIKGMKSIEH
ncbi:glycosyltransferase [Domibacillus sp. A3M-37]|uniref:glycosyltransferase family 2 protein n=1 Tax=Domibacillus sp. A3M-37 TaxID=2962037 RepID=UPI0020B67896|nr:glycosyltransferase family 2 protein [Domibacillus sp. A3M-37]MCP3761402.1 glycosyltransferase [Domibacillus sp. A3M-37]